MTGIRQTQSILRRGLKDKAPRREREKGIFVEFVFCVSRYPWHFTCIIAFNLLRYYFFTLHVGKSRLKLIPPNN